MNSLMGYFGLVAENVWLYGGAFLLVLGVLVFIHELGHYTVARMCGVKIDSFSIGFGPEMFGITDKHGTRWKFSLVPLGGYVKMFGDVDPASSGHSEEVKDDKQPEAQARPMTEEEKAQAYFAQPVGQRAAIAFAGPAINYLFAIVVLAGLYMVYGQPVTPPVAAAVVGGSAAEEAGFQPHDQVLFIDDVKIQRFEDIRREVSIGIDQSRVFTVLRDGKEVKFEATPNRLHEEDHFGFKQTRGMLGLVGPGSALGLRFVRMVDGTAIDEGDEDKARAMIVERLGQSFTIGVQNQGKIDEMTIRPPLDQNAALSDPDSPEHNLLVIVDDPDEFVVRYSPWGAFAAATQETYSITASTLKALGQMVVGQRSATEMGGIIRIGAMAGDMAKTGVIALITFMALLSINLGLINLFPIPMLDGGHLLFYAVEAVRGKPISDQVQEYAFRLGLVFLVGIMLFANLNDIAQLAG